MPYFMVHLNMAQMIYERSSTVKDKGAFYLGALAPDSISFRPGCVRSDKAVTHFCVGKQDWGDYSNCDEWEENARLCIERYRGQVNDDFLHGYFSHVIADVENTRFFYAPVRDKHDDELLQAFIKDNDAAEAVLLRKMKNLNELWSLLRQSNQHFLPDLTTCEDCLTMIDFMENELYAKMVPDPEYRASIYDLSDFMKFIKRMADMTETMDR